MQEPRQETGRHATGRTVLSGTIEKVDFARRLISLRVGREVTTLRSRKPLNLPGIRLGETIHVALDKDGAVFFGKPRPSQTQPDNERLENHSTSS